MIKELIANQLPAVNLPPAQTFWTLPPADLNLAANETHIWLTRLEEKKPADLEKIISDDERARANRFRFDLHKNHFIATRANLRIIIGRYLQTNPRKIRFEYGEFGKPSVAGNSEIRFNVSHSNGLALYAIARNREVGVDIEQIKTSFVEEGMLSQILTSRERTHFQTLPQTERELFFFECWTRKEALLKAGGMGFLLPPNQIETLSFSNISLSSTEIGFGFKPSSWSFQTLPYIPDYAAALVVEGSSPRLKFWHQSDFALSL